MKILHISPQNYTGVLTLFPEGHKALGHQSRLVTFYKAKNVYPEDICLDLPFIGHMNWLIKLKQLLKAGSLRVPVTGTDEKIIWKASPAERPFITLREMIWTPLIKRAAKKYDLWDFDVYHLEGGMSFYRNGRDIVKLKQAGKRIVCNYHGLDLRVCGAIKPIWDAADLHYTCEFDLFSRYTELEYLFLPYDPDEIPCAEPEGEKIRICHAPRIRSVKGTGQIIDAVENLAEIIPVELVLIENRTHRETLELKASCHIAIDQISDGNMGYGINSLESLSMGICTVTNLSEAYQDFIPDHPFALSRPETLEKVLRELVLDSQLRDSYAKRGREWVIKNHLWLSVAKQIHKRYRELGWE